MTIYTLTDPRNGRIFYVGATGLPLKERLNGSYACNTMKELKAAGLVPVIEAVDECERNERKYMESYWVCQFKAWGFALENKHYNGKNFLIPKSDARQNKKSRVARKLRHLIEILELGTDNKVVDLILEVAPRMYRPIYNRLYMTENSPVKRKNKKSKNITPRKQAA